MSSNLNIMTMLKPTPGQGFWYEKHVLSRSKEGEDDYEEQEPQPKPDTSFGVRRPKAPEKPKQNVVEVLQKCRRGRVQYETGWDTQPFGILKLISDVQASQQLYTSKNIERAIIMHEEAEASQEEFRKLSELPSPTSSPYGSPLRNSYSKLSFSTPVNRTTRDFSTPFHTANNTLSSPITEDVRDSRSFLESTRISSTPKSPGFNTLDFDNLKVEDDDDGDDVALNTVSPIFAQFERISAEYERERIESWRQKCKQKLEEIEAEERIRNELKQKQLEKDRKANEIRRQKEAAERQAARLALEKRILEQRRKVELGMEMQEKEFTRQQQEEKEKLEQLEEKKREAEEAAKALAEQEAKARAEEEEAEKERVRIEAEAVETAARLKAEESAAAAKAQAQSQSLAEAQTQQQTPATSSSSTVPLATKSIVPEEYAGCVTASDVKVYLASQELLDIVKNQVAHINSSDPRTKPYYSAALKVVSTLLNSIANLDQSHLQAKLNQFVNLLDAKPVYVGETMTSPFVSTSAENGNLFVLNLLAYRFVKKAEAETIKGAKVAGLTPLAAIGAQLAKRYPNWAELVKAYFYKLCPFLIPFNFPRKDLTIQQYAVAIGQEVSGNERAVQQTLLERMSGYCTLYALMVIKYEELGGSTSESEKGFFSFNELWRILATTLRIAPQLDMTATVLLTLLETIGDKLASAYRIQFRKFLQALTGEFLAKVMQATPPGKGGALKRLELFLESKGPTWFRG